ncbi:MAG: hypothetical protein ABSA16_18265 [Thermoguttaceae bacterium]|jgi:hypothetical protein
MKKIQLTRGYEALVDDVYFDWLNQFHWQVMFSLTGKPYAKTHLRFADGRRLTVGMQSLVLFGANEVDHVNCNGLDCRRENLRDCSHAQNMRNRKVPTNNTSGILGVFWNPLCNNWRAQIAVNGHVKKLGSFKTLKEAAQARAVAARETYGEFASRP